MQYVKVLTEGGYIWVGVMVTFLHQSGRVPDRVRLNYSDGGWLLRSAGKMRGSESLAIQMNSDRIEEFAGVLANTFLLGGGLRVLVGSTVKSFKDVSRVAGEGKLHSDVKEKYIVM